jgi:SMC interacting uncharacterized protein involved in chromosome segregation
MTKEELRKEFDVLVFDPNRNTNYIFDWFWSKLEKREAKIKAADEVIETKDEYINLLLNEISSLIGIAYLHGWRSSNFQKGEECRDKIYKALEHYKSLK